MQRVWQSLFLALHSQLVHLALFCFHQAFNGCYTQVFIFSNLLDFAMVINFFWEKKKKFKPFFFFFFLGSKKTQFNKVTKISEKNKNKIMGCINQTILTGFGFKVLSSFISH
jgi:hypothetical protein